jgi:hypothetical protein
LHSEVETRLLIDELMEKKEPTEEDLQNIEDLKSKEQLQIAYAVLSGNSTAIDILSAEAIPILPLSKFITAWLTLF